MDLQFWIGFWILLGTGMPSLLSCVGDKDADRRLREHNLIQRGPSLSLEKRGDRQLMSLPSYARHRKGKVPIQSLEEVWVWCEQKQNLSRRPHFLKDNRGNAYAVFADENDAFMFKMRWL
ncbi:MAG: hypothetical protein EOP83_21100 [Verrucomicrobiaceae bacterium]|nr:MAG: hypothetical protein EOP83_21100 [Verrucomicrobiaceae bacterium]